MDLRARSTDRKWKILEIRYWADVPDFRVAAKFLTELLPTMHNAFYFQRVKFLLGELLGWEDFESEVKRLGKAYDAQVLGHDS